VAREYCWAISQTIGWACYGRSGSSVLEIEFQLDILVYTRIYIYIYIYIYIQILLAPAVKKNKYCISW
jgi:hypothetical protein